MSDAPWNGACWHPPQCPRRRRRSRDSPKRATADTGGEETRRMATTKVSRTSLTLWGGGGLCCEVLADERSQPDFMYFCTACETERCLSRGYRFQSTHQSVVV